MVSRVTLRRGRLRRPAVTCTVMTSGAHDFYLHAELDAYHGAERVLSLNWSTSVPPDCV